MSKTEARPNMPPTPNVRRRWRKPLLFGALLLLIVVGTPVGLYLYHAGTANRELAEALAEADRLDPGWRLEELEARRAKIADKENSALHILAIMKLMPDNWRGDPQFYELFEQEVPEAQLNEAQVNWLRAELGKAPAALTEARKLKDLSRGRFPIAFTADGNPMTLACQEAIPVSNLLSHDVQLLAQDGKIDASLDSCRAFLNCARAIGDEPTLASVLIRFDYRRTVVTSTERVLAQGQPSAPGLLAMQQGLEEEARPLLLLAARAERARVDQSLRALESGQIRYVEHFTELLAKKERRLGIRPMSLLIPYYHALVLRHLNKVAEACKLPAARQAGRFEELDGFLLKLPEEIQMLHYGFSKLAEINRRSRAELRSAVAALAAERYRRDRGAWPAKGADLVAKGFLKAWPQDPFDGAPLRCKRLADGLVVYSIGQDGKDDGGHINRDNITAEGSDLGFRLWDVGSRRQPPRPPRPKMPGPQDDDPDVLPGGKEP